MDIRVCPNCKIEKEITNFYSRRNKEGASSYCKICTNTQTLLRQQKLKREAIEYKGGSCISCNYDDYPGALDFHHLDPSKKDFSIGKVKHRSLNTIKSELDKCILLCSNCHREIHAGYIKYEKGLIIKTNSDTLEWYVTVSDKHLKVKKDLEIIIQRYKNKETTKDIAKDYNITSNYLLTILNKEGIRVSNISEQSEILHPKKGNYPSDEELSQLVWTKPLQHLAKDFGISDVALGKYCKSRGIDKPPRGYWASLK